MDNDAALTARQLIGSAVADSRGEELGVVHDFAVEMGHGAVAYVIVRLTRRDAHGRMTVIPFGTLRYDAAGGRLIARVAAAAMCATPTDRPVPPDES